MRYMYTDKPDEGCHEVSPGVFGRPVHAYLMKKMLAAGWKANPSEVAPAEESKTLSMPKKEGK